MLGVSMKNISFLLLLSCIAAEVTQSVSDTLKNQNKTIDSLPQNPSRTAKPLQLASSYQEHDNFTNFVRLADVLDIFNIEEVARVWHQHESEFNHNCSKHMKEYFRGLQKGHLWAVKSELKIIVIVFFFFRNSNIKYQKFIDLDIFLSQLVQIIDGA